MLSITVQTKLWIILLYLTIKILELGYITKRNLFKNVHKNFKSSNFSKCYIDS